MSVAAAARHLGTAPVDAVLFDYRAAPISAGLKATLEFLQITTLCVAPRNAVAAPEER